MNSQPHSQSSPATRVRVRAADSLIAVVPYLLGFHPDRSLVVRRVAPGRPGAARVPVRPARPARRRHDRGDHPPHRRPARPQPVRRRRRHRLRARHARHPARRPGPPSPARSRDPNCTMSCASKTAGTGHTCAPARPAARPKESSSARPPTRPPRCWPAQGYSSAQPRGTRRHHRSGHRLRSRRDGRGHSAPNARLVSSPLAPRARSSPRVWPPSSTRSPPIAMAARSRHRTSWRGSRWR